MCNRDILLPAAHLLLSHSIALQCTVTCQMAPRLIVHGMRTFIASNKVLTLKQQQEAAQLHNETWTWWPDDEPRRSMYQGDTRAAIVPFLAHEVLGDSYKWLLYGDDDTVWFIDSVLELVSDLDPEMPYFISGAAAPCLHVPAVDHTGHECVCTVVC